MPDIFDEVQEDLRAERARQVWMRYGGLLSALLLLVVAAVGGFQGYRWWQARETDRAAAAFLAASDATQAQGADIRASAARFAEVAGQAPAGYRTLARLRAAALLDEAGDKPGALAAYDALSGDAALDPLYRDLASLLWVLHGLDATDPALLAARIAPLTQPGNAWRASARELQALVTLRQGNRAEARRLLEGLSADAEAPPGVRERATRLAAQLQG